MEDNLHSACSCMIHSLVTLAGISCAQVFTLPRLEPLLCTSLTAVLGFTFSWGDDDAAAEAIQRAVSVSPTGQLALITSLMALVRVGVVRGEHPPHPPTSLWDKDIATAAAAAVRASAAALSDEPAAHAGPWIEWSAEQGLDIDL